MSLNLLQIATLVIALIALFYLYSITTKIGQIFRLSWNHMVSKGSDPESASFFDRIIGRTRMYQYQDPTHPMAQSHMVNYREQNLLNSNEIRTMKDDEVLIVSGNKDQIKIPSRDYFQKWR